MKERHERSRAGGAGSAPVEAVRGRNRGTVVVIDEDPNARASAEALLSSRGWRVRSTGDAEAGFDCIRRSAAGVVVLGYAEGSPTLELVRRLRGRFEAIPLPSPPRIVVVGDGLDEPRARFVRRLGADVVLHRPRVEAELSEVVQRLSRLDPEPGPAPIYEAS